MLIWSAWLLGTAAFLGLALVALLQLPQAARLRWPGALHGTLALLGVGCLLAGQGGPPRGVAAGAGSFGAVALVLALIALLGGAALAWARLRHRLPPMLIVALHATFGIAALVMLATYLTV